ncbi:MAG: DNA polymerase III subunit delta' [Halofilum sp. (in: g-proteobacteria)]|nr:DNA polymerase III subunit delta' [Halofilum sp. (in: g-proteobacteria)]
MSAPYPWQSGQWARLQQAQQTGRLPHALLLAAPAGTGLRAFAERWGQARLCRAAHEQRPCGQCPACEQSAAGTHPDFVRLEPEERGKAIGVDAVRALTERVALTAGPQGKVALIDPADAMTLQAANALLKTLEEPPAGSVILLLSHRASRLPATVRSRCQVLTFGLPPRQAALEWLQQAGVAEAPTWLARAAGAPLAARELATEGVDAEPAIDGLLATLEAGAAPPGLAARVAQLPLQTSIPLLTTVVADLVRLRVAAAAEQRLHHPARREQLQRVAGRLDVRALFHYLDELNRAVPGPSSGLRPDMQVQGLLADAAALRRAAGREGRTD